ncbi:MAG TPA: response regulator [Telluria sp.]
MASRILIVDDEPNIVVSLEFLLRESGYEVRVAPDGEQALAQMKAFQPHLVLLDLILPALDGFDVCQQIRAGSGPDAVKIVILSARAQEVEVGKGLALGADAYLTKPFSTHELLARVRALLSGRP